MTAAEFFGSVGGIIGTSIVGTGGLAGLCALIYKGIIQPLIDSYKASKEANLTREETIKNLTETLKECINTKEEKKPKTKKV